MKDPFLEEIHASAATGNRDALARSGQAGCFHCLERFPAREVVEFTEPEGTAVCPRCGLDSVVGDASRELGDPFLARMHRYWFGTAVKE